MVNLYDSPAQAKFINTYVPIQFEHLYKLADKREELLKDGNELMDKLSAYGSLGSLSDVDNEEWQRNVANPISDYINSNVKDIQSLRDPSVITGLRSLVRRIESNPGVKNALESKEMYKQFAKEVDPRWGSEGLRQIREHNSFQGGVFTGKPLEFFDVDAEGQKVLNGIGKELIKQSSPSDWNSYYGVSDEKIRQNTFGRINEYSSDPAKLAWARKGLSEAIASNSLDDKYYVKDSDGQVTGLVQNADKMFLAESIYNAAKKGNEMEAVYDRKREAEYENMQDWAKLRFKEANENARAEAKNTPTIDVIPAIISNAGQNFVESGTSTFITRLAGLITSGEPQEALMSKFGTKAYNAALYSIKSSESSRRISAMESDLAKYQAEAAGGKSSASNAIKSISANIQEEKKKLAQLETQRNYYMAAAQPDIKLNIGRAASGKTIKYIDKAGAEHTIVSATEASNMATSHVPVSIIAEYTEVNYGTPIKVKTATSGDESSAYVLNNTSSFDLVHPQTMRKDVSGVLSINKERGGSASDTNAESGVNKVSKALRQGMLDGKIIVVPNGRITTTGESASASYSGILSGDEMARIGLTQAEISSMKRLGYIADEKVTTDSGTGMFSEQKDVKGYRIMLNGDISSNVVSNKIINEKTKINK